MPRAEFARLATLARDFATGLDAIAAGADLLPPADTATLDELQAAARLASASDPQSLPIFGTTAADLPPIGSRSRVLARLAARNPAEWVDVAEPSRTAEAVAAYRNSVYDQIHAMGVIGVTVAELLGDATRGRAQTALYTLEEAGRIFRVGVGNQRWYATVYVREVRSAYRRLVPNYDPTVPEAAKALGATDQRIRELVASGDLDGRRVGKAIIVSRKAVLAAINTLGPTTE